MSKTTLYHSVTPSVTAYRRVLISETDTLPILQGTINPPIGIVENCSPDMLFRTQCLRILPGHVVGGFIAASHTSGGQVRPFCFGCQHVTKSEFPLSRRDRDDQEECCEPVEQALNLPFNTLWSSSR